MYIIVRDIKDHTRWMNAALWGAWRRSVTVGVCLFLGILAGSWGLTRWYANQIQSLIETRRGTDQIAVKIQHKDRLLTDPGAIEDVLAVENDVVPFDRADVLEQGCVSA